MKNLKVADNNSLRRPLGLPSHNSASGMFVNLNILSFGELIRKYVYSFRNRLDTRDYYSLYLFDSVSTPIWYIGLVGCYFVAVAILLYCV